MGLIDCILRVIRANINHLIGQAEDPEDPGTDASQICRMICSMRQAVARDRHQKTHRKAGAPSPVTADDGCRAQPRFTTTNEPREALTKRNLTRKQRRR